MGQSTVIQGELQVERRTDGQVVIHQAPQTTYITLEFLTAADPYVVKASGNRLILAGQVEYRITGWDPIHGALLAERSG